MCPRPDRDRPRRRSRLTAAASLIAAGGFLGAAQQTPAPREQPTFRSGVHVVEVDVRVFDRGGRFVADLAREDFELFEEGKPQQIYAVTLVEASSPVPSAPRAPIAAEPLHEAAAPAPHVWIFLFDLNHLTPGGGFDRARSAVQEFVRSRFREGDIAGVVAGAKMVNNRLTSVREELVAAVDSVKPESNFRNRQVEMTREWPRLLDELEVIQIAGNNRESLQRAVKRACQDEPDSCRQVPADMQVLQKAQRFARDIERSTLSTFTALSALASGLAKMAGPKTVVLLSDGFVTERMETTLQGAVGQVARAGARIYAIDVRGLNRGPVSSILDHGTASDPNIGTTRFDMLADGPNSLAVDTGGLMIRNENNIGRALDRIARDTNTYYVLAYEPANTALDGKYRSIEVRVKRPDVEVRARRGYLALEPAKMLVPQRITPPTDETPEAAGTDAVAPSSPGTLPPPTTLDAPAGTALGRPEAVEHVEALIVRESQVGAITLAPAATTALARDGWARYAKGDVEGARAKLSAAATTSDAPVWVFYALGQAEFALLEFERAAEAWERVRRQAPDFREVYFDLADAYIQRRAYGDAVAVLRDATRRWPQDPEGFNALGVVQTRRDALDDAVDSFRSAIQVAPAEALAYFNLARALEFRYTKSLRYNRAMSRWVGRESDRTEAIAMYRKYLETGGPHESLVRESLIKLEWKQ